MTLAAKLLPSRLKTSKTRAKPPCEKKIQITMGDEGISKHPASMAQPLFPTRRDSDQSNVRIVSQPKQSFKKHPPRPETSSSYKSYFANHPESQWAESEEALSWIHRSFSLHSPLLLVQHPGSVQVLVDFGGRHLAPRSCSGGRGEGQKRGPP